MSGGRQARPHNVHRAVLELGERLLAEHDLASLLKLTTDVVASVIPADMVAIVEHQPDALSLEAMRTGAVVVVRDLAHDRRFAAPAAGEKTMLSGITAAIH